jgi:outer membrane protein assembly factor BamB
MLVYVGRSWWAILMVGAEVLRNPKVLASLAVSILLISSFALVLIGGILAESGNESSNSFSGGDGPGNEPLGGEDPWPAENTTFPWPMHMHDERHMGYTQSPAPTSNSVLWWNSTGFPAYGSPAVVEGKVFVGAKTITGDYMFAFYQNNGTLAWRTKTILNVNQGEGLSSSPAYSNGYLVYGGDRIYCVWASNGTIKWTVPTGNLNWGDGTPTISEGKVFIGGSDRKLYAIDLETGTVLWTFQTLASGGSNYGLYSAPAVYNGFVYLPACDGWFYRIEINQPGPIATASHSYFTGYAMYGAPVIFDGKVYIGNGYTVVSTARRFYALDVADLSVVWEFYPGLATSFLGGSAIAYDKLFVGSVDGNLYVLDPYGSGGTTTVIWQYGIGPTWSSPAISSGQVFIGSKSDFVYAFDVNQTGPPAPAWTYNTAGNVDSSPAISDGRLYIGTHGGGGRIYAFGQSGDLVSPFPVTISPTGTGVPPNTNFQVEWSEVMDWTSVEQSFSYTDGFTVWTAADGTFNHNPGTRISTFDPFVDLDFSTTYWVTFSSAATDLAGNSLDGNGDGTGGDDLVWSFNTVVDNSPVVSLWEPGGTPGQSYITGTSLPIVWEAGDDRPWPNGGNVLNITYGVSPFGGTSIAQFEFDDGTYNWDTTGIPLGTYYVNITAYDSLGQVSGSYSNFTFDITSTPDNPPIVDILTPVGGEVWSGGTVVDITWDMSDDFTPDQNLLVWLNYSYSATEYNIVNLTGLTAPFTYPWTLPVIDATEVTVTVYVVDESQHVVSETSAMFEVDSSSPIILGLTPMDTEINVPTSTSIEVVWSEAMNTTATEGSFLLSDSPTWSPVSGIISWGAGNTQITFYPDTDLLPNTWYTANFTVAAKDDSNPGNNIASPFSWSFRTAGTPDTTAPVISNLVENPDPQEVFGAVNVSAEVTDDFQVQDVDIDVVGFGAFPMNLDSGSGRYYFESTYDVLGTYTYWIFANDTSFNQASRSGVFDIEDNTPPTISDLQEDPDPVEIFNSIHLSAVITDNYALSTIRVNIQGVGNYTMSYDSGTGRYYNDHVCMMLGPHNYTIWAVDTSGNWNPATGQFDTVDTQLPQITHTPPASVEVGVAIDFQATVTDNHQVDSVWLDFTNTAGSHFSVEMSDVGGDSYQLTVPAQTQAGNIVYQILASDVSGNNASTPTLQVSVTDSSGPVDDVAPMPPWGLVAEEGSDGESTDLSWQEPVLNEDMTVLDDLAGYHLYRSESETGPKIRINLLLLETTQFSDNYVDAGSTYYYWATAVDETGNESDYSALATITFSKQEDTSSWLLFILVIVLIVVIVLGVIFLFLIKRRRRRRESVEDLETSIEKDQT